MKSKTQTPEESIRDRHMRSELYRFLWQRSGPAGRRTEQPMPALGEDWIQSELQRILGVSVRSDALDNAATTALIFGAGFAANAIIVIVIRIAMWILGVSI